MHYYTYIFLIYYHIICILLLLVDIGLTIGEIKRITIPEIKITKTLSTIKVYYKWIRIFGEHIQNTCYEFKVNNNLNKLSPG